MSDEALRAIDDCIRINRLKRHSGDNLTSAKRAANTLFNVRDTLTRIMAMPQTIESAPKDGTLIQIYSEATGWITARYESGARPGWFEQAAVTRQATHWQPLPERPL